MFLYKEGGHCRNIIYGGRQAPKLPTKEAEPPELKALCLLRKKKPTKTVLGDQDLLFSVFPLEKPKFS